MDCFGSRRGIVSSARWSRTTAEKPKLKRLPRSAADSSPSGLPVANARSAILMRRSIDNCGSRLDPLRWSRSASTAKRSSLSQSRSKRLNSSRSSSVSATFEPRPVSTLRPMLGRRVDASSALESSAMAPPLTAM